MEKVAGFIPVTQAVLDDAESWRRALDLAKRQLVAETQAESSNVEMIERAPGVWEPVGRFGRRG